MWPFTQKVRQRRLEVRKNIPTQRGAGWRRFVKSGGPASVAIALVFFAAASALSVWPVEDFPYRLGKVADKKFARVAFQARDDVETEKAREDAGNRVPVQYICNDTFLDDIETQLRNLPAQFKTLDTPEKVTDDLRKQFRLDSMEQIRAFDRFAAGPDAGRWQNAVSATVAELGRRVILSPKDHEESLRYGSRRVELLRAGSPPAERLPGPIVATNDANGVREAASRAAESFRPLGEGAAQRVTTYLWDTILSGRPTYRLDAIRTEKAIEEARNSVAPVMQHYPIDTVIFKGGPVEKSDLATLAAEYWAWKDYQAQNDPLYALRISAGRAGATLLVVIAMAGYILLYQPRIIIKHLRGVALAGLMFLMLALAKLMADWAGWNPYLAVGAATMGAVIVTIAYDRRFALATGSLLAMLMVIMLRQNIGFLLTLLAPVTMSVLLLREIRTRSKLVEVGAFGAIAAFLTAAITQLARGWPLDARLITDCGWAGGSVIAVGFLTQGLLPLIEQTFRIATSMTLLEWCDANKKLLKRLAIEAPGTYNHSLLLGTLCEAAAEAIGARGLLARVGAYYHDIGKINKPEYFVENQFDSPSKHAKLSPAMSLLIITGHVKDGLEMAREYGLPPVLYEFITCHHGTTLVQYFYHAATEQRRHAGTDRLPEEIEFRYSGPKPHSKEVAILMLADATESAVRAMSDPTPNRIEAQAHAIVTARLMDGQLDECDLTLREVHQIEESLVKSLCGMYHGRIAYPSAERQARPAQTARA